MGDHDYSDDFTNAVTREWRDPIYNKVYRPPAPLAPDPMLNTIFGPNKSRTNEIADLLKILQDNDVKRSGSINTDTSEKPVVIWESETHRVVLSEAWTLEVEMTTGADAMGKQTWVKEGGTGNRESALMACCIAFLPEKIAESVVDE